MRDISHVGLAKKRQQVVLAKRVKIDVLLNDHLFIIFREERIVDYFRRVHVITAGQKSQRLSDALRRPQQSFAVRVFTDRLEYLANLFFHCCSIGVRSFWLTRRGRLCQRQSLKKLTFSSIGVKRAAKREVLKSLQQ